MVLDTVTGTGTGSDSLSDRLRRLDAHSSVESEFRVYTFQGAIVSILTVTLVVYLTLQEAFFNFQFTKTDSVHVNATNPAGLEMEFDLTLVDVPCSQLSIDANDPTGQLQSLHLDQTHHIWKHRVLWKNGKKTLLGKKEKLEQGSTLLSLDTEMLMEQFNDTDADTDEDAQNVADAQNGTNDQTEQKKQPACGDCFGAGEEGECCDTCEDVQRAYKRKGWVLHDYKDIPQCKSEHMKKQTKLLKDEGCNVHGKVALSTGGGNLHLAPSKTQLENTMMNAGGTAAASSIFDMIFGTFVYQLDGQTRRIEDTYGMYQYYFQVVPTTYHFLNGTTIQTNQYSVTEHLRHVDFGSMRGLPGVFFIYEVSPLHVKITESYRKGWIAFFTSVCAIVGGVVTLMGMVDQYLFRTKQGTGGLAK
mmetsp:Transcript_10487/g.13891  ORF Transcript_10487/g.13891 Transcript_10487/m.13891 type:complete len:416 (-) Transcript_10487:55-1302(-)